MESEICKTIRIETAEIEERLSERIARWKVMLDDHETKWQRRRAERGPYTDIGAEEELEAEQRSSIAEYHRYCIEPLERSLDEKRRTLELFENK